MIRLTDVKVRAGAFHLGPISLHASPGSYTVLIGPTGSGKTTLLEAIAGLLPVEDGVLELGGQDARAMPPESRALGFAYQDSALFPHLSVGDNVRYGVRPADRGAGERIAALAHGFSLGPLLDRTPATLSAGERQRAALARALAPRPRALLLDEPFAAVDPAQRRELRRELQRWVARDGITVLHVSHDFEEAIHLGDRVAVLLDGRVVQSGSPEEVFRRPATAAVARFLGIGNVLRGTVRATGPAEGGRFPGEFVSGSLVLAVVAEREGECHAVIRPEDIIVAAEPLPATRNQLAGNVTRLERSGPVTYIYAEAGQPLVAVVTGPHAESLGLGAGARVALAIKATAISLV